MMGYGGPRSWHGWEARTPVAGWQEAQTPSHHAREARGPWRGLGAAWRGRDRTPRRQAGWSKVEGAWRHAPQPCIKFPSPYTAMQLGMDLFLPFTENAREHGCIVRLRPRQGLSKPTLVLVAPSECTLYKLYMAFIDLVQTACLNTEAYTKAGARVKYVASGSVSLGDFLAAWRPDATAPTRNQAPAPPPQPVVHGAQSPSASHSALKPCDLVAPGSLVVQHSDDTSAVPGASNPEAARPPVAEAVASVGQGPPPSGR